MEVADRVIWRKEVPFIMDSQLLMMPRTSRHVQRRKVVRASRVVCVQVRLFCCSLLSVSVVVVPTHNQ